jgi:hypothetical protein
MAGCVSIVPPHHQDTLPEYRQRCVPSVAQKPRSVHAVPDTSVSPSPQAISRFSESTLRVAQVMGVIQLLNELAQLRGSDQHPSLELLQRRQQLTDKILLTLLEVASATAEIVCERDRADQLADRIDEIDSTRVRRLTIASILISGVASIVSGGVGLAAGASAAGDAADVAGGVFASWFGVSALFTHSEGEFGHERNILAELWNDPTPPRYFSPIVWRYLHTSPGEGQDIPRDAILAAWRQKGRLGEQGSHEADIQQELFLGKGGRYTAPELRARASMLETLEASVRLMHEELEVLIREIAGDNGHTL